MKHYACILFFLLLGYTLLSAESPTETVRNLANNKDYVEASRYIPAALKENQKDAKFISFCGDIYFELENLDSALILYKKADDIKSQPETMRKIGRVLSLKGKHNEAIEILKEAVKESKGDLYAYLDLGQAYIKADSLTKAEFNISKAREINSKLPDPYVALGDLYFAQKVYELAKDNYEKALSLNDKLLDARMKLATAYYWMANRESDRDLSNELFERSLKEWNTITKQDPKNAKAFYEQGKILYLSKQFKPASQSFYEYIQLRPDGILGRWYLAQSLYEIGACDSAEPHLTICASQIDSVKKKAYVLLGRCYFDAKKYSESAQVFAKLKAMDTLDLLDLKRYSSASLNSGDTATAVQSYIEIINRDPKECKFVYDVGRFLMFIKKDLPLAINVFEKRLANCKDSLDATIHFFIGTGYFQLENPDSAYIELSASKQLNPNDLKTHLYLGDVYAALKVNDSSKLEFEYVIDKGSADVKANTWVLNQAFIKICGLMLTTKKYNELMKVSNKWVELMPESPYGFLYLAASYQSQGDVDNACKNYKKALKIDPNNRQAKEYLKKLSCQ